MKRQKVVSKLEAWLALEATKASAEDAHKELQKGLARQDIIGCAGKAETYGRSRASQGSHNLLQDKDGWPLIHSGFHYLALDLRTTVLYVTLNQEKNKPLPPSADRFLLRDSSLHCAYSLGAGLDCELDYFQNVVTFQLDHLEKGDLKRLNVEPFIEWLCLMRKHGGARFPSRADTNYGVYGPVMEAWENAAALCGALHDLCEFHCDRMGTSNARYNEFMLSPFDLVPVEIIALYQVRKELGLQTPAIRHPILQGRIAQMEGNARDAEDELLRQLKGLLPHYEKRLTQPIAVWGTAEQDILGDDPLPPVNPLGPGAPRWLGNLAKKFGIG